MPRHAFGLKKYRRGTSPVSKISNNEDTLPSLWDGTREAAQKVSKVSSSGAGEDAGHIFPDDPAGAKTLSQADIFKGKVAARIIQAETLSGDGEGLAGCAADEKIDGSSIS